MPTYYVAGNMYDSNDIYHYGILGQKWGIRRFQNLDGTLTLAGRERYGRRPMDYSKTMFKRQVLTRQNIDKNNMFTFDEKTQKKTEAGKEILKFQKYTKGIDDIFDDQHAAETYRRIDEFMHNYTKALLRDMGYSDNREAVEYLMSQPWFDMPMNIGYYSTRRH